MNERVNIFDIAKEAGVSIATVSRVISGSPNVRGATRDKVMRIVSKYNFKPNRIATGLSKKKSHTIGIVLPGIQNPFYTKMWIAAQQEALRQDYTIILYQVSRGDILNQSFIDDLIGKRLDGVVFTDDITSEQSQASVLDCFTQLQQYMPVVMITPSKCDLSCPCLSSDLAGATRMAIRHLMRLGHTRIALIGGNQDNAMENTREWGYLSEVAAQNLSPYPFTTGDTPPEGETCVNKLLTPLSIKERPTALICFNDMIALGAIKQLQRMGYKLPDDMAIVSCDNQFFAPYTNPPLTTVDLRIEDTARQAVHLLTHAEAEPLTEFHQLFEPTLIVRESCGASLNRT